MSSQNEKGCSQEPLLRGSECVFFVVLCFVVVLANE